MTGITFLALNGIQRDVMNDTRYARDLGLLLAGNVTELVAQEQTGLANVAKKILAIQPQRPLHLFADPDGVIYLGIPISGSTTTSDGDHASTGAWNCRMNCRRPRTHWCASTSPPRAGSRMCSFP